MIAVIMAAGFGSRLGNITTETPKALLRVNSIPLIDYSLNFLDFNYIEKLYIVGGFQFSMLREYLNSKPIKNLTLLENADYIFGNILTLKTALPFIDDTFLLMNVDHIYPRRMFKKIIENTNEIKGMCDFDRQLVADDMKIKLNKENKIAKISKTLTDFDGGYIGMTLVSKSHLDLYKSMFNEVLSSEGNNINVERVLGYLADKGKNPSFIDLSGFGWLEIDDVNDLNKAKKSLFDNDSFLI